MTIKSFPKFSQKINSQIQLNAQQSVQPNLGVVVAYNQLNNMATVIMTNRGSEAPGEIFHNVPCPRPMGIQSVAPEQGCQVMLSFKDGKRGSPIIVSYHNTTSYLANNYTKENTIQVNTPTYIHAM